MGTFAVGFAAINTGNNLLYLLLGAMLGLVVLSGWASEQAIRGVEVVRRTPRGTPVGEDVRIAYHVRNRKRHLHSTALEVGEEGLPGRAFFYRIAPGEASEARSLNRFVRRGVYPLRAVTLSTTFPFGLFLKERDVPAAGELVVWPRTDRPVRPPRPGGGRRSRLESAASPVPGASGEYRSLRQYRVGDPPRDIHWRRSARLPTPVVREYEREGAESYWLCLDTGGDPQDPGTEECVDVLAALAARATREGRPFGVTAGARRLLPSAGPGHLEAVLDLLARVDFGVAAPTPGPPAEPSRCVLVTARGATGVRWGDVYVPERRVTVDRTRPAATGDAA